MAKAMFGHISSKVKSARVEGGGSVEGRGGRGSQTCDYIEHVEVIVGNVEHMLRVHIHNDSVCFQSYGVVAKWDGNQWQPVANVRGDALQMEHGVGYRPPVLPLVFKADRDTLMKLALEVLS